MVPRLIRLLGLALLLAAAGCGGQTPTPSPPAPPGITATVGSTPASLPTSEEEPAETPTPAADLTPTLPAAELRGLNLSLLHPFSGELDAELVGLAAEFNSTNEWGVRVETRMAGGSGQVDDQVSQAALSGEDLPDLAIGTAAQILEWAGGSGLAADLAPFAGELWPGEGDGSDDLASALVEPLAHDGSLYGIPLLTSPRLLFYNQSWARELGFDQPPATLEEFEEQSCAASQALQSDDDPENDGTGGWVVDSESLTMLSWLAAYGVADLTGTDLFDYQFEQPAAENAFAGLRGWLDDGCIWLGRQASGYEYFAGRMALFASGQVEEIAIQQRAMEMAASADTWTVLPFPQQDGEPVVFTETYYLSVLSDDAPGQSGGWLFAEWLSQPANLARLAAAEGSVPASTEAMEAVLPELQGRLPQWAAVPSLMDNLRMPPARASWRLAGLILEDAGWRLFQPSMSPEQVAELLPVLDDTIREVGGRQENTGRD